MVDKYQKHKERIWKEANERYENLFEEKNKRQKRHNKNIKILLK